MSIILAKLGKKAFRKRHLNKQTDIAVAARPTIHARAHGPGDGMTVEISAAATEGSGPRTIILDLIGNRISNIRNLGFGIINEIESQTP